MADQSRNRFSKGSPARTLALALLLAAPLSHASDIVYCEVDYTIVNDWGAGFQVDVVVTNTAAHP